MTPRPIEKPDRARIKTLLTKNKINRRVSRLAARISRDYAGKKLTVVSVLKGGVVFFADLIRRLEVDCSVDFISLSSYDGKSSSGKVTLLSDLKESPKGKHVLIVEDIVDSGRTLKYILKSLARKGALSVRTCVLLDKVSARKTPVRVDYRGFTVPDRYVIGYGLDYNEHYRGLPHIAVIED
ncbi:MAG: hypoxanthine phosphoribosyltransferase [Endomicrobiales bacterium]|nr:hypoxanthine phosphoribosyltransferase [Endomicrobiales bacterium]